MGQEKVGERLTVLAPARGALIWRRNRVSMPAVNPQIPEDDVCWKTYNVQLKNQLTFTCAHQPWFVGMETGQVKRMFNLPMLELNKRYGMSKFIIVVPPFAIKEGRLINKSLKNILKPLCGNSIRLLSLYDSSKPADVKFCNASLLCRFGNDSWCWLQKTLISFIQSSEKTTLTIRQSRWSDTCYAQLLL